MYYINDQQKKFKEESLKAAPFLWTRHAKRQVTKLTEKLNELRVEYREEIDENKKQKIEREGKAIKRCIEFYESE